MNTPSTVDYYSPVAAHRNVYLHLYDVVRQTMRDGAQRQRIYSVIEEMVEVFAKLPNNDLLLQAYSHNRENFLISHIVNNTILAIGFAQSLNLKRQQVIDVGCCAFGHDFGMTDFVPLLQSCRQLNKDELSVMQSHPQVSIRRFEKVFPDHVLTAMGDMHERFDGKGYPFKKSAGQISEIARIVQICDVFEALTHPRPFRTAGVPYQVLKGLIAQVNKVYDKNLIKAFVNFMSIFPIGTLVQLNSGEIGLVIASNHKLPTRPFVRIIFDADKNPKRDLKVLDLKKEQMIYVVLDLDLKSSEQIIQTFNPRMELQIVREGA
jgi:HD-GYP domain-containing protein (c-di-GMP phosphodiesterase class II)